MAAPSSAPVIRYLLTIRFCFPVFPRHFAIPVELARLKQSSVLQMTVRTGHRNLSQRRHLLSRYSWSSQYCPAIHPATFLITENVSCEADKVNFCLA